MIVEATPANLKKSKELGDKLISLICNEMYGAQILSNDPIKAGIIIHTLESVQKSFKECLKDGFGLTMNVFEKQNTETH